MTDDTQRTLGRLENRADNHEDRLVRIEEKLDHLVSVVDAAKGGWKALVAAGAIASALTAVFMKVLGWLTAIRP